MYVNLHRPDDWNMYAGGTCAAEGRHSYDKTVPGIGQYMIDPVCWPNSLRHRGYIVRVANVFGKLADQPGLYRDLSTGPVSLTKARSLAQAHLASHLTGPVEGQEAVETASA